MERRLEGSETDASDVHEWKALLPIVARLDGSESDTSDAHEWKAPTAMAATFAHPIEFLASNFAPGLLGVWLFQTHYVSTAFFLVEGLCATLWSHSGYEKGGAHDLHHEFFVGNYGHLGICDWLHGTARATPPPRDAAARKVA